MFALGNRHNAINNYCGEDDIVLDIDSDDALIGKQALKFVNAIYHDP